MSESQSKAEQIARVIAQHEYQVPERWRDFLPDAEALLELDAVYNKELENALRALRASMMSFIDDVEAVTQDYLMEDEVRKKLRRAVKLARMATQL